MKAVVYIDGGARGNPGPAGIAAVLKDADGEVLTDVCEFIGTATNNVAEYRALLLGLQRARDLGVEDLEIVNDSELVARQLRGEYKVKHTDMRQLFAESMELLRDFERWSIRNVPREENAEADALVNQAIDSAVGLT